VNWPSPDDAMNNATNTPGARQTLTSDYNKARPGAHPPRNLEGGARDWPELDASRPPDSAAFPLALGGWGPTR